MKSIPAEAMFATKKKEALHNYFIHCVTHDVVVYRGSDQADAQTAMESISIERHHLLYKAETPCDLIRYIPYYVQPRIRKVQARLGSPRTGPTR